MRIRFRSFLMAVLATLSLCCSLAVWAADPDMSKIIWKVALAEDDFSYKEPIYLTVTVINGSAGPVAMPSPELGACTWLTLKQPRTGKELKFVTEKGRPGVLRTIQVPAGESRSMTLDLHDYVNLTDAFGDFDLSVVYGIDVAHPFARADKGTDRECKTDFHFKIHYVRVEERKALGLIHPSPRWGYHSILYDPAACIIATHYQDSAYYKYSYYWLGKLIQHGNGDYPLAMHCYDKLLNIYPDFPLRQEVKYRQLNIRAIMGEVKDRPAELRKLLKDTTDVDVRAQIQTDLEMTGEPEREPPPSPARVPAAENAAPPADDASSPTKDVPSPAGHAPSPAGKAAAPAPQKVEKPSADTKD